MKNIRRRSGRTDSEQRFAGRERLARTLRAEALEPRQLMAGDAGVALHHNSWHGRDVNNDLRVTPMDALIVLNELNRNGVRELSGQEVQPSKFVDVNGDNRLTALDALQVINALNRGSGEDVPVVEVMLGLTDDQGNSLLEPGTRTANLGVGQIVNVEVQYTDRRLFGGALGLFTVYTDIIASQTGVLEPLITETQVLSLSENFVDSTGGSVTLRQEGSSVTATIPFASIASNPATAIRNALINTFGYTSDEIFTSLETREPRDPGNGRPVGDPFDVYVRFLGDRFIDTDVPNFTIDASGLTTSTGQPVVGSSSQINPRLEDGSINPVAVGFALDTRSRTANGQNVYTNVRQGSFNDDPDDDIPDGFSGIGATGQLNANGVPSIIGSDPFEAEDPPFEAFSIRARVVQPIENFQLSLGIPLEDANETVLVIYGNRPDGTPGDERGLSPQEVVVDEDGVITINVTQAVTARPDTLVFNEKATGTINVLQNDLNQGAAPLTIQSVTNGANGTVTFTNGTVTYTPNSPTFFGTDTFTYVAVNGDGDTATGVVNVTVNPVNDPPTASDFQISVTEGTVRVLANNEFISRASAGPANEQQTPVLTAVDDAATLGTVVLNEDGSVTYTAPVGYQGPDSFQYTISDGEDTVTATVNVVVLDQNDPPVAGDDTIEAVEDEDLVFTAEEFAEAILSNDVPGPQNEIDAGQEVELVSWDTVGSAGGTITENSDGTYTYSPPANVFGTAAETFTYTITDGELTDTGTITINIAAVNDAPIAVDDELTVDELTEDNELDVLANDSAGPLEDGQAFRIARIVDGPDNGTATVSADGQRILYTPESTFAGTDTLTYVVVDADGLESEVASVTIDVVPVIRPRARGDRFTIQEDSGAAVLNVLGNDLANEGAEVTLETIGTIPAAQGTLTRSGDNVVYTPAADFFGTVTFTYTISDTSDPEIDTPDEIAAATGTVTITVEAVNDAPIFVPDSPVAGTEDVPLTIAAGTLLANDRPGPANESNQTLSITSVASASSAGGTVTLDGQTIRFTPPTDYNGNATITYTIADSAGGTTTGTVTVTLAAVNDPPVLDLATDLTAAEDVLTQFSIDQVLGDSLPGPATATDEQNQTLTITAVGTNGATTAGGTVSLSGGQIRYRSAQDYFGSDSFTVTVRDSGGATRVGTVTLSVTPVNDPPVVGDPELLAFSQSTATFTPEQLLAASTPGPANESDQTLSVVAASALPATRGSIQFSNGSVIYTPEEGFVGTDSFQITISDGQLQRTGTITVDVREFEPSTVRGSVFFDYIASVNNPVRDGVKSDHEPGLQMARVILTSGAADNVTGTAIEHELYTNVDGDFEFTNVPPGTYQLRLDLPPMVYDGPDYAGTLGDSDTLQNSFTFTISEPGGLVADDYNFTLLGYNGRAGNGLDLLVSSYMNSRPELARTTDNGLMGAKALVGADGTTRWFTGGRGFEGVSAGEINLSSDGSAASLTVIMDDGSVRTGLVSADRMIVLRDGSNGFVVQIFGGLDSFGLQAPGAVDDDEAGLLRYRQAVDMLLAQNGSIL